MADARIGFAVTGSFCTFKTVFPQMKLLCEKGYSVLKVPTNDNTVNQQKNRRTAITLLYRWYNLCHPERLYACNRMGEEV